MFFPSCYFLTKSEVPSSEEPIASHSLGVGVINIWRHWPLSDWNLRINTGYGC